MDCGRLIANKAQRADGRKEYDTSRYAENLPERANRNKGPDAPIPPNNPGCAYDGWGKVADRCAIATEQREGKDIEGNSDQMEKFPTDGPRGFGAVDLSHGVGPFGMDLARSATRGCPKGKTRPIPIGAAYPLTLRRRMATPSMEYGSMGCRKEGGSDVPRLRDPHAPRNPR